MWQRFTERARKVVFYAQEEAQWYGEGFVSTEHLLLGLCRESDSVAARVLEHMGVSLSRIRAEVDKQLLREEVRSHRDMTLTPRAKRVIDLAYDEARMLNDNYIGTEHLLLGLIRGGEGLASQILTKIRVDLESTRLVTAEIQAAEREGRAAQQVVESRVTAASVFKPEINLAGQLMGRLTARAWGVAAELRQTELHTEHFLIALAEEGGLGATILSRHGLTSQRLREELIGFNGEGI